MKIYLYKKINSAIFIFAMLLFSVNVYANGALPTEKMVDEAATTLQQIETRISLDMRDATVRDIIYEIQRLSRINIYIEDEGIDELDRMDAIVSNMTVKDILDNILKGTGFEYKINSSGGVTISKTVKSETRTFSGKIVDSDRKPIVGAVVVIKSTGDGSITNENGEFIVTAKTGDIIDISCMGYHTEEVRIRKETTSNMFITLKLDVQEIEDVTVVAFGTQSTESMVSSVTSIRAKDLKSSSSDLTSQFAGKIAGMIGWQTGGMPGALTEGEMNTKFYIRGITSYQTSANIDPLILLDGVESSKLDLARINPDDIESFSVLKDATATAMYGARGANGVILVETRKGTEGNVYTTASYEVVTSMPTAEIDVVDPITYMEMYNQAEIGRDQYAVPRYNAGYVERTQSGNYPDWLYPQNDWYDIMFKPVNINHRANVTARGGSKVLQYYASLNYTQDQGMLKTDKLNDFDVNIKSNTTTFRTNLTINLAKGIQLNINSAASVDVYRGPHSADVATAYDMAFSASPVDFAAVYPADDYYNWEHVRFGAVTEDTVNPYLKMHEGYIERSRYSATNRAEYIHKLDDLVKGLEFRASMAISNVDYSSTGYTTIPIMYGLDSYNFETGEHKLVQLNGDIARRTLEISEEPRATTSSKSSTQQYEARALHTAAWGDHQTSLTGVAQIFNSKYSQPYNVLEGLQSRNVSFSMRGTYGYKDRYFAEASFGYNGSERFAEENRMGFFPAVGASWIVSKEKFMQGSSKWLSFFKLRASWGKVGNDGIFTPQNATQHRFTYLPAIGQQQTGSVKPTELVFDQYIISSYANPDIQWEILEQLNIGLDVKLFDGILEFNTDIYQATRHNILDYMTTIPASMGIQYEQLANTGSVRANGIDFSGKFQHTFTNDFWVILNGTLTYSKATYLDIQESSNTPEWQKKAGKEISQQLAYIAEGLFKDEEEIATAPIHPGTPEPGDIRYKDINNDGLIDVEDAVYVGYPETPRLIYGFNGFINYKDFEFSFAFQGSGNRTFFIDPVQVSPFVDGNAMLSAIYEDHWSANNQATSAFWPKLSVNGIDHNNTLEDWYGVNASYYDKPTVIRKSTYFMREVAFLRCTSLEFAYNVPHTALSKLRLKNLKLYVRANNPFMISNFDLWDVELGENGFNYPIQKTYSLGINVSF